MKKYCMYDVNTRDFIESFTSLDDVFNYVKLHGLHGVEVGKYKNECDDDYELMMLL